MHKMNSLHPTNQFRTTDLALPAIDAFVLDRIENNPYLHRKQPDKADGPKLDEYDPAKHMVQDVAPSLAEYNPDPHKMQLDEADRPKLDEYDPERQAVQVFDANDPSTEE